MLADGETGGTRIGRLNTNGNRAAERVQWQPGRQRRRGHDALDGLHEAGKREVEMYIRTYQTLLRSSGEVGLKALVQAHYNIDSVLHPEARSNTPDMSAFIYAVLRVPTAILQCSRVLLGQSEDVFAQQGFQVEQWQAVTASARRRKWFFDGKNTLAAFIASVSDTDDIVPTLVALQIEWNKFHWLLNADPTTMQLLESRVDRSSPVYAEITKVVRERLQVSRKIGAASKSSGATPSGPTFWPSAESARTSPCACSAARMSASYAPPASGGRRSASCWTICAWDAARSISSPAIPTACRTCSPAPSCAARTS